MSDTMTKLILAAALGGLLSTAAATPARADDNLALQINPVSGSVSILNASPSALSLDGYTITSSTGELATGGGQWQSLSTGDPNWTVASSANTALAELNLTSSTAVGSGNSVSLGNAFTSLGTQDVQFSYSTPAGTVVSSAAVQYASAMTLKVVNLLSNHGASVVQTVGVLANFDPVSASFDGYSISSAAGSLNPAGLKGLSFVDPTHWNTANLTANGLSELNLSGALALAANHDVPLGAMFTTGATQDATLLYDVAGYRPVNGVVSYSNELFGDVDHNGVVNGLDISLIAGNWLSTGTLPGDTNYDGVVNGLDIGNIAGNWLHTLAPAVDGGTAVAPVPEPSTLCLVAACLLPYACHLRRRAKRRPA